MPRLGEVGAEAQLIPDLDIKIIDARIVSQPGYEPAHTAIQPAAVCSYSGVPTG